MKEKVCKCCGVSKPITEFGKNARMKDGLHYYCKECKNQKHGDYRTKKRQYIQNKKRPCEKCGESRLYLIQFHHRNPAEKSFEISQCLDKGIKKIDEEINKCVCLCPNCHAEFHYFYGVNPENPEAALKDYLKNDIPLKITA